MTCRRIHRYEENRPKRPPEARKSDKNTANTQQVRFFKLYFDINVFSAENRRLFSIEFQLHTNSHITLWLPVIAPVLVRFGSISSSFGLTMGILARLRLAQIRTMARPNSPDMPPKRTKMVRLGIITRKLVADEQDK